MGTKVALLDGGSLVIDRFHAFWNKGPAGEYRFPCYSVLIEHADGRFLFDTGFDYDHVMRVLPFEKPLQTREQTIPGALDRIGLRGDEIDFVINSHYHFDHCGGNRHLINATTLCHAAELEACNCHHAFEHLGYSDLSAVPTLALDIYTPRFETLRGDQEIARGIWLFETPGHTAGHYSLMVELSDRRPMLFTADACYSAENMATMTISSFHLEPVASLSSMHRLKALAEKYDAELFYSHDPACYPDYRLAPFFFS